MLSITNDPERDHALSLLVSVKGFSTEHLILKNVAF